MTCRHSPDDPNCSSHPQHERRHEFKSVWVDNTQETPDSKNFEVQDAAYVQKCVVLKVKYPNCAKCAYEGTKVLVYYNINLIDVLKWREIDPHFASEKEVKGRTNKQAPSPVARFPATPTGWSDAVAYANGKK